MAWLGSGNGQLDTTNVTIDSIQFEGATDAQVYLDDVFWDPQAVYVPPTPGDFNRDGIVNAIDLPLWQAGYGLNGGATLADGDANDDGRVDGTDFLIWQENLGIGTTGTLSLIPEPSALILSLMGMGLMGWRCRLQ